MPDDHDISPVGPDIAGKDDDSVPDGMNGVSEGLSFASRDHPVLPEMSMGTESAGFTKPKRIGWGHRKIESVGSDGICLRQHLHAWKRVEETGKESLWCYVVPLGTSLTDIQGNQ